MSAVRPGVVDLRDLGSRSAWEPRAFPRFVAAAGLAIDGPTAQRFAPPHVVVVIAPYADDHLVRRSRAWLADAAHVVVVRDHHDDGDLLTGDPELIEAFDDAWATVLGELGSAEAFDWYDDPAPCRAAIARALALAATVEPAPAASPPAPRDVTLPTGPWCAYTDDERRPLGVLAELADRLGWRGDRPGLALDAGGGWIDLVAPPPRFAIGRPGSAEPCAPRGARPDRSAAPGRWRLGFDPSHRVGWRGERMRFYWSYVGATGVGFLSASDHDYPCGPAKKLYGHEDNDPVQVVLSPAADVCVARFGHDVLVTSAVPIGWQPAGAVDVATFPRDPRRAVWFAQDPDDPDLRPWGDDLLDDDARDLAPALVLGPDAAIRYAVDLGARVYRIDNRGAPAPGHRGDAVVVEIGGATHGYAVFDADHREVRRGAGRLLGGWFRWATIEHDGHYWREDLATGARTRLAPVDHAICEEADVEAVARDANLAERHDDAAALRARHRSRPVAGAGALDVLAIPGTRNVLLVGDRHLRVI